MRNRNMSCVYRIEVSKSMELKQKYQQPKAWKSECILTLTWHYVQHGNKQTENKL